MHMLSICLSIVRIAGNKLTITSAGMPPALIDRRHPQSLEEIKIKGMPDVTFIVFPYETRETALNTGDSLLLISDGFPKLFNADNELFGYDCVGDVFMQPANEEVGDIIEHLKTTAAGWSECTSERRHYIRRDQSQAKYK